MFGDKSFIVKIFLIWSIVNVVLVESSRQKKDVHHMIYVNEEVRPPKTHRHRNHVHGTSRRKRKPSRTHKYKHSSSSEISLEDEDISQEKIPPHKPKSKNQRHKHNHQQNDHKHEKQHRNNHKNHEKHESHIYHKSQNGNRIHPESYHFPHGTWTPMTSQELFVKGQRTPVFSGGYQNGALQSSQPVPVEITTTFPMPPNTFVNFDSTLYPPLNPSYDRSPQIAQTLSLIGPEETYKPFDYSVLEQKPQNAVLNQYSVQDGNAAKVKHVAEHEDGNSFPIVVDGSAECDKARQEKGKKSDDAGDNKKSKEKKRGRGSNSFRVRNKNKN